jgi:CheY-like chemotaxis protein
MNRPADSGRALYMAALSHAIRSRLNAVLGSLELLSQSALPEAGQRFVDTAIDEGRGLLYLVNDALDLGRIEAGEARLDLQPMDPVAVAEGALGALAARLHERGTAAVSVVDPATPVAVRGDAQRLRQVLVNLLDNARKATEGGSVTLRLWPMRSDARGEQIGFEIIDTGRGVPEAKRDRLFEPMVPDHGRADWALTSLGLGLALCRRVVEMMGGTITYEPRPGGGSIFRFDAWFRRGDEFERLSDLVAEVRDRRVLLVDDDRARRLSFAEQVRKWGVRVRVVADGRQVEAILRTTGTFDLVLVHQDAYAADLAVSAAAAASEARICLLVPVGHGPRLDLAAEVTRKDWLSAPMRRRSFVEALMGRPLPAIDLPDLPSAAPAGRRGRVLVIEDSEANRMVLRAQLERLGCEVDIVDGGAEGVRLVSQRRYDLVLTDLLLPDMSGLDVAVAVRGCGGETGRVPIVAVTGGTDAQDRQRCLAVGINAYLTKPVAGRDLDAVLDRFLRRSGDPAPAWDASAVDALAGEVGGASARDIVESFARELGQRLARIDDGALPLAQLGREAHALKSAARTFGAVPLADAAVELERLCRESDEVAARAAASALFGLGRPVVEAVRRWLDRAEGQAR